MDREVIARHFDHLAAVPLALFDDAGVDAADVQRLVQDRDDQLARPGPILPLEDRLVSRFQDEIRTLSLRRQGLYIDGERLKPPLRRRYRRPCYEAESHAQRLLQN